MCVQCERPKKMRRLWLQRNNNSFVFSCQDTFSVQRAYSLYRNCAATHSHEEGHKHDISFALLNRIFPSFSVRTLYFFSSPNGAASASPSPVRQAQKNLSPFPDLHSFIISFRGRPVHFGGIESCGSIHLANVCLSTSQLSVIDVPAGR